MTLCTCTFSNEAEKCPLPGHDSVCPERRFKPRAHSSPLTTNLFLPSSLPLHLLPLFPCIHLPAFSKFLGKTRDSLGPPHLLQNIPPVAFLLHGLVPRCRGDTKGQVTAAPPGLGLCVPCVDINEDHPHENRQACLLKLCCSRGSATSLVFWGRLKGGQGSGGAS